MSRPAPIHAQRGATLIVALIMLILITLMVISAYTLSTSGFRTVGNMQFRDEAVAAANAAIGQLVSEGISTTNPPAARTYNIDIDQDGTNDYVVNIAVPQCVKATTSQEQSSSSLSLPVSMSVASFWHTVWDMDATVASASNIGGAAVRMHSGVRILLSQADKDTLCPTP